MEYLREQIYLDREALAKRFCMSTRSIDDWRKDPEDPIPYYKIGSKVLFYWPLAVQWMERRRVRKPADPEADVLAAEILGDLI